MIPDPLPYVLLTNILNPDLQKRTEEMRVELGQARDKVYVMERAVRTAERNLDVSRVDQQEMNRSLALHVGKIDSLLGVTRKIKQTRADMKEDINCTRRRFEFRSQVYLAFRLDRFL